jgi:hypothetical protein
MHRRVATREADQNESGNGFPEALGAMTARGPGAIFESARAPAAMLFHKTPVPEETQGRSFAASEASDLPPPVPCDRKPADEGTPGGFLRGEGASRPAPARPREDAAHRECGREVGCLLLAQHDQSAGGERRAMPRNWASSALGSTPSAAITAMTMESERISLRVGSRVHQLVGIAFRRTKAGEIISFPSCYSVAYSAAIRNGTASQPG